MSVLYKIFEVSSGTNDLHNRNAPIPFDTIFRNCIYLFNIYCFDGDMIDFRNLTGNTTKH